MKPTPEQQAVLDNFHQHNTIKVDAVAGSGKTSLLEMLALANPDKSFLYLAYNKAMQLDAEKRMPTNVECRTTHSVAYQAIGKHYQHKLKRPEGGYVNVASTGGEISKKFGIPPLFDGDNLILSSVAIGNLVKQCVARFEHSADTELSKQNISENDIRSAMKIRPQMWVDNRFTKHKERAINIVLKYAKMLWTARKDVENNTLISHDTYLKLYQLSRPVLKCDVLLVDEAQDGNPCFIDIVKNNFDKCKVVFVGDAHQAIYQWRGSVNAMEMFDCASFPLSKSFRYGQDVADIAMAVLDNKKTIVGYEGLNTTVCSKDEKFMEVGYTLLFRTNFALVQEALILIAEGKKVNLQMDVKDLCSMLVSAEALFNGETKKVKHYSLVSFESWYDFKQEVEYSGDTVGERIIQWVEGNRVSKILNFLQTHKNVSNPDVVLTTAHKAKGLEWQNVVLANDFPSPYNSKGEWVGMNDLEKNLLYVACTRAKKNLVINESCQEYTTNQGFTFNTAIYNAEQFLSNPHLQLPKGEFAKEAFHQIMEHHEHHCESEQFDNTEDFVSSNESYGEYMYQLTGVNPTHMPTLSNLERDCIVLGNLL
jgi:superfamily I DNA/RNA helicase